MYDLVIRNATIVDGTGKPAFCGDLAVSEGKIVAVDKVEGEAEMVQLELKQLRGELITLDEAKEVCNQALAQMANDLDQCPRFIAARINPDNPRYAEKELRAWVEEDMKPNIQSAIK